MKIVFLLEEKSMKFFLDGILPDILPENVDFVTIPHEGKSDLHKSIPIKMRAWNEPNVSFVIVQDQDSGDCKEIKKNLVELCKPGGRTVLVRIACHELEAWYFGDLKAVSQAYGKDLTGLSAKRKYRIPDEIIAPKQELYKYLPEHQQISGARKIAQYIDVHRNTSASFNIFIKGVRELACRES